MKTVSIVMATYNGSQYLRPQIESILAQTYPLHEIIIQDDHSTDKTADIVRQYSAVHPNIHLWVNPTRLGYKENFRTATLRATGDLIALADQDDIWYPDKIEAQVHAIGAHDLCYSHHHRGVDPRHTTLVTYKNAPERQLFAAIVGHSLLMRRDYAQNPDNWLGYMAHDIGLSLFAHFHRGVVRVDRPLNFHRSHDDSVSTAAHLLAYHDKDHHPTWQPYIYGLSNYRRLQRKTTWQAYHRRVQNESRDRNPLVYQLCTLMLSPRLSSLLRLCLLCMRHRHTIYPSDNTQGLRGAIRSFFFPFIHSYHCTFYDG